MSETRSGLFASLLGSRFAHLHDCIRRVHDERPRLILRGECTIERGYGALAALATRFASLPPAGINVPLTVTMIRDVRNKHCDEVWERNFNGHIMRSHLWQQDNFLAERLGLMTLLFALTEDNGDIIWTVRGARLLGMPLPTSWFANSTARETQIDGRYSFDVRASLPLLGLLIHYRGWLEVVGSHA